MECHLLDKTNNRQKQTTPTKQQQLSTINLHLNVFRQVPYHSNSIERYQIDQQLCLAVYNLYNTSELIFNNLISI